MARDCCFQAVKHFIFSDGRQAAFTEHERFEYYFPLILHQWSGRQPLPFRSSSTTSILTLDQWSESGQTTELYLNIIGSLWVRQPLFALTSNSDYHMSPARLWNLYLSEPPFLLIFMPLISAFLCWILHWKEITGRVVEWFVKNQE